ncbi:MAG: hypothetical protein AB8H12_19610 [Lewinella sp.]
MPYTHVFVTHAILQEYLTEGIIRQENIDLAKVLVLRVRGSYRTEERAAYRVLDGGDYSNANGRNLLKHRRTNKQRYLRFKADVLDQLAPDFQIYSPMYTYWYLNVLASRAEAYHVLEDGFGSYQSREELKFHFGRLKARTFKQRIAEMQRRILLMPGQRETPGRTIKMLDGVGKCYGTLDGGFPWKEKEKRIVVKNVFPPSHVGEYEEAWIMGTSCLVEAGYFDVPTYQEILREVLRWVVARGIEVLYFKLHPTQALHPVNAEVYRKTFAEFSGGVELRELPQDRSIERIAAGNQINFITGISTLGFHVASTGGTVYRYFEVINRKAPGSMDGISKTGISIFRHLSHPL